MQLFLIKSSSAIVPIFLIYYIVQKIYITTSREIQRLDSICKSPVMALFSESLGGLSTIRAYLKYGSLFEISILSHNLLSFAQFCN